MAWTDDRVEKLKTMWTEGMSASQIAKELGGVTRNAVIGKVHRLGLSSRNQGKATEASEPAAKVEEPPAAPEPASPPEQAKASGPVEAAVEEDDGTSGDLPSTVIGPEDLAALPSENQVDIAEIDRGARKLSLMELTERTCKWPIGDPSRGEFYFCGHPVVPGKPYCKGHTAAAYQPMSSRRDRDRARNMQRPAITRSA